MKTLNSGFSLVELLVATGIGGLLFLLTFQLMNLSSKSLNKEEQGVDDLSSELLAYKQISKDVAQSIVSFNTVAESDNSGKNFFDFIQDFKCISSKENCERVIQLTLTGANPKASIHFLLADKEKNQTILYPPIKAYVFDLMAKTLRFESLNQGGFLDQIAPGLWRDGQFLILHSPLEQRPLPVVVNSHGLSELGPAKRLVFVGRVSGTQMLSETFQGKLRNTHPLDHSLVISQADTFLRKLPSIGGTATMAFVEPVRMIKYWIEKVSASSSHYRLNRSVAKILNDGSVGFDAGEIMATHVQTVVFKRDNISSPVIKFSVVLAPQ